MENVSLFIKDLNQELSPLAFCILYELDKFENSIVFEVKCHSNRMINGNGIVNFTKDYVVIVNKLCIEHFKQTPEFNNTGSLFWVTK